ncbi:hypothetical protein NDU88_003551 [Pleurodeles waltl]|uniref:Uncharacterized protein n=1 Tax=Pleurodeles waltl TaxID=8319 RepID=A0AAV7T5E4_PLEWA|nr:hypothetical protein NDU88_003551 [Pleurodeles waltl]
MVQERLVSDTKLGVPQTLRRSVRVKRVPLKLRARGNVTACRTYFCVLPAVAFSRALEREEKRRLKAAEPEDVTAAVPVLDRNKRPQIFTTLLTVFSQHNLFQKHIIHK